MQKKRTKKGSGKKGEEEEKIEIEEKKPEGEEGTPSISYRNISQEKPLSMNNINSTIGMQERVPEEQIKKERTLFRNILIVLAGFAVMFFVVYMVLNSLRFFEVEGVKFEIVKEGQLTFYNTYLPVTYQGSIANYNFYLRNDPRTLKEKIPIIGNLTFRKNIVMDVTTQDLYCAGDWPIGLTNVKNLYSILDINLLALNKSIIYAPYGDYMFITINIGNSTEIRQTSPISYDMNVSNCEILPAFERLMLESFIRNKELNP